MKPVNNLLGQRFGRLLVQSRTANPRTRKNDTAAYWKCLCDCEETVIIRGYSLTIGKTRSCGCLKKEAPHLSSLPQSQPIYFPEIAAARIVWRTRYKKTPFEDFFRLALQNCFYCNAEPCLEKEATRKDSVVFRYNTLDRIDSSKEHIIGNVVPACLICNRAKFDRHIDDFYTHANRLITNLYRISPEEYRQKSSIIDTAILRKKSPWRNSLRSALSSYINSKMKGIITETQFYQLVSSNCYYCLIPPSNKRNAATKKSSKYVRENGDFFYNGLDRVDNNNRTHDYNNVVPSCKWCNFAKLRLTIPQFDDWILRLDQHRPYRKPIETYLSSPSNCCILTKESSY